MGKNHCILALLFALVAAGSNCTRAGESTLSRASLTEGERVLGLGTVIYQVRDLARAKEWYSNAFGVKPYFDESFYVGFNLRGYELGLNPDSSPVGPGPGGSVAYWRVEKIDQVVDHLVAIGAKVVSPVQNVGDGVKVATLADPEGNLIGLVENPLFRLPD